VKIFTSSKTYRYLDIQILFTSLARIGQWIYR